MRIITLLLFSFFAFTLHSQSITLRVLGQSTYLEPAKASGVLLHFGVEDVEQAKNTFRAAMDSAGIAGELKPMEGGIHQQTAYRFEVQESSPELFGELVMVCEELSVKIKNLYYKLPPHNFADEDHRAIMALKNAASQAAIIAKNLDCKVARVLNIDDETSFADPLFDSIDFDSKVGEALKMLMDRLVDLDSRFKKYSSSPVETKGYNIWVTYELRPN